MYEAISAIPAQELTISSGVCMTQRVEGSFACIAVGVKQADQKESGEIKDVTVRMCG